MFCNFSVDLGLSAQELPKICSTVSQLWLSEKIEIMSGATHALEILLKDVVGPLSATKELVGQFNSHLEQCFKCIEAGLSYQYHNVWHQVLHLIAVLFEVNTKL